MSNYRTKTIIYCCLVKLNRASLTSPIPQRASPTISNYEYNRAIRFCLSEFLQSLNFLKNYFWGHIPVTLKTLLRGLMIWFVQAQFDIKKTLYQGLFYVPNHLTLYLTTEI